MPTRLSTVSLCVLLGVTGCASPGASTAPDPAAGAAPLVITSVLVEEKELWARSGVLSVVDGCLLLEEGVLAWPAGTTWDPATDEVVLVDGSRLGHGDPVEAAGSPVQDMELALGADGARAAAACGGIGAEVGIVVPDGYRPVLDGAGAPR